MDPESLALKTAHIIGGGPSIAGVDFSFLKGAGTVVGVNDAYRVAPCDHILSIDGAWMRNRWQELSNANARAWLRRDSFEKHVGAQRAWPALQLGECKVWETGPGPGMHCLHGNNSGLVGLHYAYHLAPFDRFFLYGLDMQIVGGRKHGYPEYDWRSKGDHMFPDFARAFNDTAALLKEKGAQVYNVCPGSALTCFEKVTYAQAKNLL